MNRVVLLGTKGGPAVYPASADRMPASSLMALAGERIVVDCGLGVTQRLVQAGVDLKALKTIIITHLHSDHYLELGPLLHTAWTAGLASTVRVIGPDGLRDYWQAFLQSMAFDIDLRIADEGRPDFSQLVSIEPISPMMTIGSLALKTCRNNHPPIEDSFALRFEANGKSVLFSGDTAPFDGWADFVRYADLLVHEAMIAEGVDRLVSRVGNGERLKQHLEASHTDAVDVGRLAAAANVRQLALNHLVPSDDPLVTEKTWIEAVRAGGFDGPMHVGRDLLAIEF